MTKPAHHIRFVRAILFAAVPACSATPSTSTTAPREDQTEPATEETATSAETEGQADAGADAELPFSSGPLMPPVYA